MQARWRKRDNGRVVRSVRNVCKGTGDVGRREEGESRRAMGEEGRGKGRDRKGSRQRGGGGGG